MSRKSRKKRRRKSNAQTPSLAIDVITPETATAVEPPVNAPVDASTPDIEARLDVTSDLLEEVLAEESSEPVSELSEARDTPAATEPSDSSDESAEAAREPITETPPVVQAIEIVDPIDEGVEQNEAIVNSVYSVGEVLDRFINEYNALTVLVADGVAIGAGAGNAPALGVQEQLSELRERLAESECERESMAIQLDDAQQQNELLNDELATATANLQVNPEHEEELLAAKERNAVLTDQLIEVAETLQVAEGLEGQVNDLANQLSQARTQIETLESELHEAKSNESDSEFFQQEIQELHEQLLIAQQENADLAQRISEPASSPIESKDESEQVADLQRQITELEERLAEPQQQAESRQTASWEDRKAMMFEQMDADEFDAESFVASLQDVATEEAADDPIEFVNELHAELIRQESEIKDLKSQLESTAVQCVEQTAAVIEMDQDERAKLDREWEDRLKDVEVRASLERARFSRDIRELARRNDELEQQLSGNCSAADGRDTKTSSRRWLARFGLN